MNQRVARFKPRHDPVGWINLEHPTQINRKFCRPGHHGKGNANPDWAGNGCEHEGAIGNYWH